MWINAMTSQQLTKFAWISDAELLHIHSPISVLTCLLLIPHFRWLDTLSARSLTVLGWTDDIKILNATMYPVHIYNNSPDFMCASDVSG